MSYLLLSRQRPPLGCVSADTVDVIFDVPTLLLLDVENPTEWAEGSPCVSGVIEHVVATNC